MLTRVGVPVTSEAEPSAPESEPATLLCFSHLRWNFVFQRPQHLMSRFAREMNVIFWEEPVDIAAHETAYLQVREAGDAENVRIVVPHLPQGMPDAAREAALMRLLDAHIASIRGALIAWYYTPMMLPFSRHITPDLTVFDAMDELSKFKFAPTHLLFLEQELLDRSDIVFTGGSSLFEAKKDRHDNVHCFPSSVDRVHFLKARARQFDPADQEDLPKPRLGFYGVIDERFDIDLLDKVAAMRPQWSFVMVGPVVKISEEDLPQPSQYPLSRRQDLRAIAGLSVGLGRGTDAVRDERIDAVHLADQNSRISRRRQAGGVEPDQGCGPSLRPA